MTDSSTAGYLLPTATPLVGQALTRVLQQAVVNMTGLPGEMVRPYWQSEPANVPDSGDAWAALGIQRREAVGSAWQGFLPGTETYEVKRIEDLDLLVSFYDTGVTQQADKYAETLRECLQIGQNRDVLVSDGLGYTSCEGPVAVPVVLKQTWLYRVDLSIRFRREMVWQFPILSLTQAVGQIKLERDDGSLYTQNIQVGPI